MSSKETEKSEINDIATTPISKSKLIYSFFVLYSLFVLDLAARQGVLSVFPSMQAELGLSDAQVGLAGSIVLLGMSMFVLPFSYMGDKVSKKYSVGIMGAIWGLGCMACAMATNAFTLISGRFLIGMGNSSYAPVSVSMLTSWIKQSRWGTSIGFYNSAMPVGMALGTMIAGFLSVSYSWRMPFIVLGVLTFVFVILAMFIPNAVKQSSTDEKKITIQKNVTVKEATKFTAQNKTLILLSLASGTSNLALASMATWIPMYLVRSLGWTIAEVGAILGPIYLIGGILVAPLGGMLSDFLLKFSRRMRVWLSVPLFILVATSNFLAIEYSIFAFIIISSLLCNLPYVGYHIATQELVPTRYKASAYGTYVIILQGMGFVGPILTGYLSGVYGLNTALICMQVFFIMGAFFATLSGVFYMKDYAKAQALEN